MRQLKTIAAEKEGKIRRLLLTFNVFADCPPLRRSERPNAAHPSSSGRVFDGAEVNRQGVPEDFPQGDEQSIAEAISYVQKIPEQYPDKFAKWAATSNILNKVGNGDSVRKATVNRNGQTEHPVAYPANTISSTPGAGKTVMTSDLSKLVADAENFLFQARMHEGHLKAKRLHQAKLAK